MPGCGSPSEVYARNGGPPSPVGAARAAGEVASRRLPPVRTDGYGGSRILQGPTPPMAEPPSRTPRGEASLSRHRAREAALAREDVHRGTPAFTCSASAGGRPDRRSGSWPFAGALLGLDRVATAGPRGPSIGRRGDVCSHALPLLNLRATFPGASRSLRPGATPGFLSWGCPKNAPPSGTSWSPLPAGRSRARGRGPRGSRRRRSRSRGPAGLRSGGCRPPPAFRPRGFPPPRRFPPPTTVRALFHPAADPGVHRRFPPVAKTSVPRDAFLPFEAFPPPVATSRAPGPARADPLGLHAAEAAWRRAPWARVTAPRRCRRGRSPRTLPSRPFAPIRARVRPRARPGAGAPGPCSTFGSVACRRRGRRGALGAPLGLSDSASSASACHAPRSRRGRTPRGVPETFG